MKKAIVSNKPSELVIGRIYVAKNESKKHYLLILIFFLAFSQKLSFVIMDSYFKVNYFLLFISFILLLFKILRSKSNKSRIFHILNFEIIYLILLLYILINIIYLCDDILSGLKLWILMFLSGILYLFIKNYAKINSLNVDDITYCFRKANFLFVLISLLYYFWGIINPILYGSSYGAFYGEGIVRLEGLTFNPIMYGLYITPYYFLLLVDLFCGKKSSIIPFILTLLTLILTVSKAPIGINLLMTILYITYKIIQTKKIRIELTFIVPFIISIVICFFIFVPSFRSFIFNILENRINDLIESGGSGRKYIWAEGYYDYINSGILWGRGFFELVELAGVPIALHNTYLEYLFNTGLIGFGLFISMIIMIIVKIFKIRTEYYRYFLILTSTSVLIQLNFIDAVYHEVLFIIPVFYVVLTFNGDSKKFKSI
ncbi:O-antigen ligase family protein [Thermolongibacillus altinsuensis]